MARTTKTVQVQAVTCDACGADITHDDVSAAFLVMHGPASWRDENSSNSEVLFEWSPEGDYCRECLIALCDGISSVLHDAAVVERYERKHDDPTWHDSVVEHECDVIAKEKERRTDR